MDSLSLDAIAGLFKFTRTWLMRAFSATPIDRSCVDSKRITNINLTSVHLYGMKKYLVFKIC